MVQAYAQELLNQKESATDVYMQEYPPHPLMHATQRLVNALERLENSLAQVTIEHDRDVQQEQQLMFFARENDALRLEREHLNAAITQLQAQYGDLQHVAVSIYDKLDESVCKLTKIIEG